jgi:hypothetical protein
VDCQHVRVQGVKQEEPDERDTMDRVNDMVQKWTLDRQITESRRGEDEVRRQTLTTLRAT